MEVNKLVVGCIYRAENCKNQFKIVEQIIFKKKMMWQLMWHNVRAAALNATFQLLVIYRLGMWIMILKLYRTKSILIQTLRK